MYVYTVETDKEGFPAVFRWTVTRETRLSYCCKSGHRAERRLRKHQVHLEESTAIERYKTEIIYQKKKRKRDLQELDEMQQTQPRTRYGDQWSSKQYLWKKIK